LLQDFNIMRTSLLENNGQLIANGLLDRIMRSISAFGLTHATMDIREHSDAHHKLLTQLFGESDSQIIAKQLLATSNPDVSGLDQAGSNCYKTFVAINELIDRYGSEVIESYIISMTKSADREDGWLNLT